MARPDHLDRRALIKPALSIKRAPVGPVRPMFRGEKLLGRHMTILHKYLHYFVNFNYLYTFYYIMMHTHA